MIKHLTNGVLYKKERILQNDDDPFKLYMTTRLLQQIMTLNNTNETVRIVFLFLKND